jgi:hypothetical protein
MKLALACLALGIVLMVPFDHTITRILGVAALMAFVVTGVFALAGPSRLAEEDDE